MFTPPPPNISLYPPNFKFLKITLHNNEQVRGQLNKVL